MSAGLRRIVRAPLDVAVVAVAAITAVPTAYLGVLSVVGAWPRRTRRHVASRPTTSFAILVPAHDEAAGIGATLASFDSLDYPHDMFSVEVVADNCTDDTVGVVRSTRWSAHERTVPDDPGKGPALNWLLSRLVDAGSDFDAVVIVDADTSLHPDFLTSIDQMMVAGADAVQGRYSVRDPDASPSASFRYAALACRHRLRPLGRTRLGASCGLYGNGMAFRRELVVGRPWSGHLVEDAEFQMELLLDGHLVSYADEAVLWAEMPNSFDQATSQNERWERGRLDLARSYLPRLIRTLPGARRRRVATVDAILDHLVPPLSVLVLAEAAAATGACVSVAAGGRRSRWALAVLSCNIVVVAFHAVVGLVSAGGDSWPHVRALTRAPWAIMWKARLWLRVVERGEDVEWARTNRNVATG